MSQPSSAARVHEFRTTTFFSDNDALLKVASSSPPHPLAMALVRSIQEGQTPIMRAIGHGAVGQAVKAQIIARGLAAPMGLDLVYVPGFDNVLNDAGEEISTIIWRTLWR